MKLTIGNYPKFYTSLALEEFLVKCGLSEKMAERIALPYDFLCRAINLLTWDKPRVKIRVDRWDTYSAGTTLSYVIVPILKQLRETKQGAPLTDDDDVPDELKSINSVKVPGDYTDSNWFNRWDYILDEMIWAFTEYQGDWEDQFHRFDQYELVEGTDFYRKVPEELAVHIFDKVGHDLHRNRIINGQRLFAKYYFNLWD